MGSLLQRPPKSFLIRFYITLEFSLSIFFSHYCKFKCGKAKTTAFCEKDFASNQLHPNTVKFIVCKDSLFGQIKWNWIYLLLASFCPIPVENSSVRILSFFSVPFGEYLGSPPILIH